MAEVKSEVLKVRATFEVFKGDKVDFDTTMNWNDCNWQDVTVIQSILVEAQKTLAAIGLEGSGPVDPKLAAFLKK